MIVCGRQGTEQILFPMATFGKPIDDCVVDCAARRRHSKGASKVAKKFTRNICGHVALVKN